MQVAAGMMVTPNVRLVSELGHGAMGAVWIADHLTLGTQVAVKVMQIAAAQRQDIVQRFHREAATAARLKSPHIAQVFDHGVLANGMPYLVMELLDGHDLGKRLASGAMTLAELAPVVTQVGKALTRAHQSGVVHRDIKPDNVFLTYVDGELHCKILDFGVAKEGAQEAIHVTSTGTLLGTPLYMSPEQLLSSRKVDHRSDLWALGVLAYHATTLAFPFVGETLGAISVVVNEGKFTPPSALNASLPPAFDRWMAKALARDPADRFESAREMAQTLERVARGEPFEVGATLPSANAIVARSPSLPDRGEVDRSAPTLAASMAGSTSSGVVSPKGSSLPIVLGVGLVLAVGGTAAYFVTREKPEPKVASPVTVAQTVQASTVSVVPAPSQAPPASSVVEPPAQASATASAASSAAKPPPASKPRTGPRPKPTEDTIGF